MNAKSPGLHPPKARLALRVGVTGHRPNRLPDGTAAVHEAVHDLLLRIQQALTELGSEPEVSEAYGKESPLLRLISPLAEGADRIAAEAGLALGYKLQCPLPFPRQDYAADFESESSRREYQLLLEQATAVFELDGDHADKASRQRAYEAVGRLVVNQTDVLIALWDGRPAEGKGGTGEIVKFALRRGVPVVQINPHQPQKPNWLIRNDDGAIQSAPLSNVITFLRKIIQPPQGKSSPVLRGSEQINRKHYFDEELWPQPRFWQGAYRQFVGLLSWSRSAPEKEGIANNGKNDTSESHSGLLPDALDNQIKGRFNDHYAWADSLAIHYANRYRSTFVLAYLLSALAVLLPLVSHLFPPLRPEIYSVDLLIASELAIITGIGLIVWSGWKHDWHQRWIDYRLLAETLRVMRFLLPIGKPTPQLAVPAHDTHDDPANTWMNWHARSIARETGLLNVCCNRSYLESYCRGLIGNSEGIFRDQRNYHAGLARCTHLVTHRLHRIGMAFFITILIAGGVHLLEPVFGHVSYLTETTILLAAFLPALGASLAGILTQGEFERIARRSTAMAGQLGIVIETLTSEIHNHTSENLGHHAETAAQAMLAEVLDWRIVFLAKPLGLPA